MAKPIFTIESEGDLEVMVLLETHSLLADIIGPDFYAMAGKEAVFHSRLTMDYFIVRVIELSAPGNDVVKLNNQQISISLLGGLKRVCANNAGERAIGPLHDALDGLCAWLETIEEVRFWCGEISQNIKLSLPRQQMISIVGNAQKHHALRLSSQLEKISKWCAAAGVPYSPLQLINIHDDLVNDVRDALCCYSNWLLELLGKLFLALNQLVADRFTANPTNDVRKMKFPAGLTSDVFRDFYGSTLVFHRYEDDRILRHSPTAGWYHKNSYWKDR
jgi:hypothetical protein